MRGIITVCAAGHNVPLVTHTVIQLLEIGYNILILYDLVPKDLR